MREPGGFPAAALKLHASVAVASLVAVAPAHAVDLVNRDKVPREVVVNGNDGESTVMTLKPQEKVTGVCKACVILSGRTSVEATGNVTVMVEDGKASIGSKR
jgi:hypothetical protein